ncbi:hypothetical protein ACFL08_02415 [Patescibacteria group bacterium]
MKISSSTELMLDGRGIARVSPGDYKATGGEGSIYRLGGTIIKLYTDTHKMLRDRMPEKLSLLSKINNKFIVAPKGLVLDRSKNPLGYFMDYVDDGEPLPRVFTNAYRNREGFGDDDAVKLVDNMMKAVQEAHKSKSIMVDHNEMNWLTVKKVEPRIIDVDSWAIDRWKATVIMPSIRDWHTQDFNESTDWFSWGIVTFQVFAGIHPYKGKLNGYKTSEMERRMKENKSVFTTGVRLNKNVRDFSSIPSPLLDWYFNTFQKGQRNVPPSPFQTGPVNANVGRVARFIVTSTGSLSFDKIFESRGDEAIRIFDSGLVILKSGRIIELSSGREIAMAKNRKCEIIDIGDGWLKADVDAGEIFFSRIKRNGLGEDRLSINLNVKGVLCQANRMFAITERGLSEVKFMNLKEPMIAIGNTWDVKTNSTLWFSGVGIQDSMGSIHLVIPYGEKSLQYARVKELDGLRIITAKAGNRFVTVIALDKNGDYQKLELAFDVNYRQYSLWKGVVDNPELNVSILKKGICATIVQDGELVIFNPFNGGVSKIQDKYVSTDMILSTYGEKVACVHNGGVWRISTK